MHDRHLTPFTSALILADSEGVATIDRSALRGRGVRHIRFLSSGKTAARLLADQAMSTEGTPKKSALPAIDLVICNATLDDMDGAGFLRLIRSHPALAALPVILVSPQATRQTVLDAIGMGCSGFLIRPYTTASFEDQLALASAALPAHDMRVLMSRARGELDTQAFEAALAPLTIIADSALPKAEALYNEGMTHLTNRNWDGAIRAFNRAVRLNVLYAEAYSGLSRAWRGKGDFRQAQRYLRLAGEAYARLKEFAKAREVFALLLRERPETPNVLLGTAETLLRQGKYDDAARAYVEGHRLTPQENLTMRVARACHLTDKPEHAARALCRAMQEQGATRTARQVYQRIVALPARSSASSTSRNIFSDRFPRLRELVSVVAYTARLYKEAGQV